MSDEIIRDERGRFLRKPSQAYPLNAQNARELAKRRWDKTRRAAVERIVGEAASIDPTVSTYDNAYALAAVRQYQALLDYDKPAQDQLDKLRRMMTGYEGDDAHEQVGQAPQMVMAVTELVKAIRDAITPANVIDNNSYHNHDEDDDT